MILVNYRSSVGFSFFCLCEWYERDLTNVFELHIRIFEGRPKSMLISSIVDSTRILDEMIEIYQSWSWEWTGTIKTSPLFLGGACLECLAKLVLPSFGVSSG